MLGGLLAMAIAGAPTAVARALRAEAPLALPPDPRDRPPALGGEAQLDVGFPAARSHVCPEGAGCVLDVGAGVTIAFEARWPRGTSLGAAYDALFSGADAVYEIATHQALRFVLRHYFLRERIARPFLEIALGPMLFGDAFGVDTVGGVLLSAAGAEVEISEQLALTASLAFRAFSVAPFTTGNDGVRRADDFGAGGIVSVRVGLLVTPARR